MQKGDLVKIQGFAGGPIETMVPDNPYGRGIPVPPGTTAMVLEVTHFRSRVLMACGIHWIFNDHMEVVNESR